MVKTKTLHPLIALTEKALKKAYSDKYDRLFPKDKDALNIRVSRSQINRAIVIVNEIVTELVSLGYEIKTENNKQYFHDSRHKSFVIIEGRHIGFQLEEKAKRIDHVLTEEEAEFKKRANNKTKPDPVADMRMMFINKYDFVPSGVLTFHIDRLQGAAYMER